MAHRPGSSSSSSSAGGQFGDTTLTKIFVGGLAWETQCETMRRYFEQFGEIAEAVVITDKNTGRSKGYGFVTFRDAEAARRACMDPAPVIDGRRTNCNLAALGAHRPRPSSPLFQGARFLPFMGDLGGQVYGGAPHFGQPLPFAYQQGFPYPPPFGYAAYPPEYYGAPNVYSHFVGPQFPPAVYSGAVAHPLSPTFHQQQQQQQQQGPPQNVQPGFAIPPLITPYATPQVPTHLPPFVPIPGPFHSPPGHMSSSAGPGPSPPRYVLPSPSAQPFTPGAGSEQSSG